MSLVKYNGNNLLDRVFGTGFFNDWMWDDYGITENSYGSSVKTYETDKGYNMEFSLPGISSKDLKVEVKDGMVSISGSTKTKNSSYSYSQTFTLPKNVNYEKTNAVHKNGILTLEFELKEESKPKQIPVKCDSS